MDALLHYWPILAFISSLFVAGLGVAIGLTLWIMGKLIEQDAKRIEMKESILREVRERHGATVGVIEQKYLIVDAKIDGLREDFGLFGNRLTKVETLQGNGRVAKRR